MTKQKERPSKSVSHIVSIRDVLRAINHYEIGDLAEASLGVETLFSVSEREAREVVDAAVDLGYITDGGELTTLGEEYQELLDAANAKSGAKEDRVWPTNVLRILRGLPGAGKTVLGAAVTAGLENAVHLEIDEGLQNKVSVSGKAMKQAALSCIARTEMALLSGKNVVVSNIFARYKDVIPYFEIATYHSIRTQLIDVQGQWNSPTRSDAIRNAILGRWALIALPVRWKPWLRARRLQLEQSRRERNALNSKAAQDPSSPGQDRVKTFVEIGGTDFEPTETQLNTLTQVVSDRTTAAIEMPIEVPEEESNPTVVEEGNY